MTRRRKKKPESTPLNDEARDKGAPELTGEALVKAMQDPRARDLVIERTRTPARIRRRVRF